MEDNSTNHALTEVALALAMAFFSIMILAMVSMSVPHPPADAKQQQSVPQPDLPKQSIHLTSAAKDKNEKDKPTDDADEDGRTFVFYFKQQFYNQQLKKNLDCGLAC